MTAIIDHDLLDIMMKFNILNVCTADPKSILPAHIFYILCMHTHQMLRSCNPVICDWIVNIWQLSIVGNIAKTFGVFVCSLMRKSFHF